MSTDNVIQWIDFLGGKFMRLNGDEIYDKDSVRIVINNDIEEIQINQFSNTISEYSFNIAWYRRWRNNKHDGYDLYNKINGKNTISIYSNAVSNDSTLKKYILSSLNVKKWLTHPDLLFTINNKLINLRIAKHFGLNIPSTIICSRKLDLLTFFSTNNKTITKDLSIPYNLQFDNGFYFDSLTQLFPEEILDQLQDNFMPTLFQECIEKEFEIRSFYLDSSFYSMAIFSQNDDKTKVDFRNYNWSDPNRTIPYKIPTEIEKKLNFIFKKLNINTGSVDIIKGVNGVYYFLEINPIGQFGMTSFPCNYKLEKKIAQYLIKNDK